MRTLLYGLSELWHSYFQFRKIPWRGDKEAIKYLMQNDTAFLGLIKSFISEQDNSRKIELYTQIAATVTAPVGGLWQPGDTAVTVDVPDSEKETWKTDQIEEALKLWHQLLGVPG